MSLPVNGAPQTRHQMPNLSSNVPNNQVNNTTKYTVEKSVQTFFGQWDHLAVLPEPNEDNTFTSHELLLSVNTTSETNTNLPLIEVTLFNTQFPFLLDSGSSISIYLNLFFKTLKVLPSINFLQETLQ